MKNLHTFNEFVVNEDWFNFLKSDKKITNDMKAGQIVCLPSTKSNIIHVFELVDPALDTAIFIGNFKLSDEKNWIFKTTIYLKYDPKVVKGYRPLNDIERKMIRWYFSTPDKIEKLKNITKIQPIF